MRSPAQGRSHGAPHGMCWSQAVSAAEGDCTHSSSSDETDGPWVTIFPTRGAPRRSQSGEHACRGLNLTSEVHRLGHQPSGVTIFFFLLLHPLPFLFPLLPASASVLQSTAQLACLPNALQFLIFIFFNLFNCYFFSFFFIILSLYKQYVFLVDK